MSEYEDAIRLWESFRENPVGTYEEITNELANAGLVSRPDPDAQMTPDEVQEWRMQRELAAYDAQIGRIVSDPANADIDPNLIHTFVAAAEGDFDQAVDRYRAFAADFLTRYGHEPNAAPPAASTPAAPDYRAQGLTPKQALDRAVEDAVAMSRARRY